MAAIYYAVRRLAVPGSGWVSVVVPIAASQISIVNTGSTAMLVRTEGNADYYKRLPANAELTIRSNALTWEPDNVICELASPQGDATAEISFIR